MSERMFPIQSERGAKPHPTRIPWSIAELAYSVYSGKYGRDQSLERLASRGGFGPGEMDTFVPDWRERCDEIASLRAQLAAAAEREQALRECVAWADDYGYGVKGGTWDELKRRAGVE